MTTRAGEILTGVVGSADLLFDRRHLSHRDPVELEGGAIGSAWLKVAVDLDPMLPEGWAARPCALRHHFSAGARQGNESKEAVREGARVLAVDLGLRTFAACSVFELRSEAPDTARSAGLQGPAGQPHALGRA